MPRIDLRTGCKATERLSIPLVTFHTEAGRVPNCLYTINNRSKISIKSVPNQSRLWRAGAVNLRVNDAFIIFLPCKLRTLYRCTVITVYLSRCFYLLLYQLLPYLRYYLGTTPSCFIYNLVRYTVPTHYGITYLGTLLHEQYT
jgi:hypothetical protein